MLIRLDDGIARQPLVLAYSALLVPRAEIGVDGRAERGLEPPRLAWAHRAALQRALDKHKKEVILLNSELARSKRDEDRARRHAQQLDGELKMLQRRAAASRAPARAGGGASARTASSYRASSAPGSRQGSRAPSAERSAERFAPKGRSAERSAERS